MPRASRKGFTLGNGSNELAYSTVGMTFTVDTLSFDFRYWGNSISNNSSTGVNHCCDGSFAQCDDAFQFTGKFTF